jgi:hypothetical protein
MKMMMVDDAEENQGWMVSGHETVFCWGSSYIGNHGG